MITQSALKQQLDYDPDSGYFTWKEIRGKAKTNKPAGTVDPGGYRRIRIFGVQYFAAQLVWIWMTGSPTNKLVDHKNGITDDNRWINLREASHGQNTFNQRRSRANTSGIKGVSWVASRKQWLAQIGYKGKMKNLGRFDLKADAEAAVMLARDKLHGEFACHG